MFQKDIKKISELSEIINEPYAKVHRALNGKCTPRIFMKLRKLFGKDLEPEDLWENEEKKQ